MNSRLTMALAGVFLLGAILAAYWGVQLSRAPAPVPVGSQTSEGQGSNAVIALQGKTQQLVDDAQRASVVVLAKDIAAGQEVTAEDIAIERLSTAPPGSISDPASVIGQRVWLALPAGTWLSASSFELAGPLAKMINSGERALALAIDEVVGAGGYLRPGDFVDVLSVMPSSDADGSRGLLAQVVAPALRVLTVGAQLGPDSDGQPLVTSDEAQDGAKSGSARTVVLAIPEALATRVTLASQAGQLRLAVRSAEDHQHLRETKQVSAPDLRQRVLVAQAELSANPTKSAAVLIPSSNAPRGNPTGPRVEVIRAGQSSWQTP